MFFINNSAPKLFNFLDSEIYLQLRYMSNQSIINCFYTACILLLFLMRVYFCSNYKISIYSVQLANI